MNITVLGEGAWGSAIAHLLADNGHSVKLWCYNKEVAQEIQSKHTNSPYLPDIIFPPTVIPVTNIAQAIEHADWICEAIPVKFLRPVLEQCKLHVNSQQKWIILSKGIESNTLLLPSQIVDNTLNYTAHSVILSGPSFAHDVARRQVTGVNLASTNPNLSLELSAVVANNYFKTYSNNDPIGIQICSAIKNVVALAIGVLDGAGYTDNTKTLLFMRALDEIAVLIQALGGKQETIYTLSGIGDLVLTTFGTKSKNLQVGKQLGQGKKLNDILSSTPTVPESINTLTALQQLIDKYGLNLPIFQGVHNIVFNQEPLKNLLTSL